MCLKAHIAPRAANMSQNRAAQVMKYGEYGYMFALFTLAFAMPWRQRRFNKAARNTRWLVLQKARRHPAPILPPNYQRSACTK